MTNEEYIRQMGTRDLARMIAEWHGYMGNTEEVNYWEKWLKSNTMCGADMREVQDGNI